MEAKKMDLNPTDEVRNDDFYYDNIQQFVPKAKLKNITIKWFKQYFFKSKINNQ